MDAYIEKRLTRMVKVTVGSASRCVARDAAMAVAEEMRTSLKSTEIPQFEDVADPSDEADVVADPLASLFKSKDELRSTSKVNVNGTVTDHAAAVVVIGPPSFAERVVPTPVPSVALIAQPSVANRDRVVAGVSTEGKVRSLLDLAVVEEAGFAPRKPLYERGTLVNSMGVRNARRSRQAHEAKPLVTDYCQDFHATIVAEQRRDLSIEAPRLRMDRNGQLGIPRRTAEEPKQLWHLTQPALQGITQRLGFGGATYLQKCWPVLRQTNFNAWLNKITETHQTEVNAALASNEKPPTPQELTLRLRKCAAGGEEVYGAVTEKYTAFDVDMIAQAIKEATPKDARGTVVYDGYKAKFEIMFHSNVQPEKYVAGEFFKSGVIIRTDDTGGGSILGSAVVWQNLCMNLIIIDQAKQDLFRIRHMGDLQRLIAKFRAGFAAAMGKLEHFRSAWGYAVEDNVVEAARTVDSEVPMKISEAMPGLFNGILERELVPVKGRREESVKSLMKMWESDTSAAAGPTRAAVANAFTRFAHEVNQDPFIEDEIQRAAGLLIYSKKPLPFLALDAKKGLAK